MTSPKRIRAIDLFCGAGGLTTGLKEAGIDIVAAIENDKAAVNTYKANHPEIEVFDRDIRTISGNDIIVKVGKIDMIVGCPPCQGFSSLTFKNKGEDERNLLVLEFLRLVREISPEIVMMENVPGLSGRGSPLFEQLMSELGKMKYCLNFDVLQVADFGIPQRRKRLVLIGAKGFEIKLPSKTHSEKPTGKLKKWKSLKQAIGGFKPPYYVSTLNGKTYEKVNWNIARELGPVNKARIKSLKQGESRYSIPLTLRPSCHKDSSKGFGNVYGRLIWDEPSVTITRGCTTLSMGRFGHPEEERALSVREAATIQTFPRRYKFKANSIEKACILIGNAFPCRLAKILGEQIVERTLKYYANK